MRDTEDQIFFSYASSDRERVQPIYKWLVKQGINAWIDFDRLMPGQNWDFEIKRALEKSRLVIVFISSVSSERRGYVQRELVMVLDKQLEKLVDDIYIIPVILDYPAEIPDQIRHIQCISVTDDDFLQKILKSVTFQLGRFGVEREKVQREQEIYWSFSTKKENWDGLPGYNCEIQFLQLSSDRYPGISEIAEFLKGDLLRTLFNCRSTKLSQMPDSFNYGQSEFERTNTFDAHCMEPVIVNRVIGIQYSLHYYHAGAAHPNMGFATHSFFLEPVARIETLEGVFEEAKKEAALAAIQGFCRDQLRTKFLEDQDWIDEGTKDWSCFRSFLLKEKAIELLFAPYAVACYAAGPQSVSVPYELVVPHMRKEFISSLGIEAILYQIANAPVG